MNEAEFRPSMLATNELDTKLQTATWKKSTRGNEHEYILEFDYADLVHIVQMKIREEGVNQKYRGYPVRYWIHGGYRYWVMPGIKGLPKTLVLNRVPESSPKFFSI
jgi:hypothetical protein